MFCALDIYQSLLYISSALKLHECVNINILAFTALVLFLSRYRLQHRKPPFTKEATAPLGSFP